MIFLVSDDDTEVDSMRYERVKVECMWKCQLLFPGRRRLTAMAAEQSEHNIYKMSALKLFEQKLLIIFFFFTHKLLGVFAH